MTMVDNALKTMEIVYCELQPGDALFFHSNLLHRSEANLSENSRWSVISCYSRESNIAYNEPSETWRMPLETLPDSAVMEKEAESFESAAFLKKEDDRALKN
jgi:ectoine hydroxylase-related dioxygenase (phytanoyl-CoA dioxygenase family)